MESVSTTTSQGAPLQHTAAAASHKTADVHVTMPAVTVHVSGARDPKQTAAEVATVLRTRVYPPLIDEIRRASR